MSIAGIEQYVQRTDALIEARGIRSDDLYDIDTVCYDVETNERYEELRRDFAQRAMLISETPVNNRLIAVFEFSEPIVANGHRINYLELPQPKRPGTVEGISHVQYVTRFGVRRFVDRYSAITFEEKGNPDNRLLQLSDGSVTARFHDKHMGAVIEMEQNHA